MPKNRPPADLSSVSAPEPQATELKSESVVPADSAAKNQTSSEPLSVEASPPQYPVPETASELAKLYERVLEVLYDEGPCLVVNKPHGLLTQGARGIPSLDLLVKAFCRKREQKDVDQKIYLTPTHRIDRPVTGAVIFARNSRAAARLSEQFRSRTIQKIYWAFVAGEIENDEGTWVDFVKKNDQVAQASIVTEEDPQGKKAILSYKVLQRINGGTWLEIELETGRYHQIRVQAAHHGYPIVGDDLYGSAYSFGPEIKLDREKAIALHARYLKFKDPMIDKFVEVTAPLPLFWQELDLPSSLFEMETPQSETLG